MPKAPTPPKPSDARAKKLFAAFVKGLSLKRSWDMLSTAEKDAWRAVSQVQ